MKRSASETSSMKRAASGARRGGRGVFRTLSGKLNADENLAGIFKGITVTVQPSKGISNARKAIIEMRIEELGGGVIPISKVETLLSCGGNSDAVPSGKVNRIIVRDANMGDEKFLALLKLNKIACPHCSALHVTLVEPDVIDTCVQCKTLPESCTTPNTEQQNNRLFWGEARAEPTEHVHNEDEAPEKKTKRTCSGSAEERSNAKLVKGLARVSELYSYLGDEMRSRAFKRAAEAVARHAGWIRRVDPHKGKVVSVDALGNASLVSVAGVGRSSLQQMKEFLEDGSSHLLRTLDADEKIPIVKELMLCWGVGCATATRLHHNHGVGSWQELQRRAWELRHAFARPEAVGTILTFLDYFPDLHARDEATGQWSLKRIPREEVGQLGALVQAEIDAMAGIPLKVHCCGSYRRGKSHTGDIDMVLEASGELGYEYRLDTVVENLQLKGIVQHLVKPSDTSFWSHIHRSARRQGEFGPWSPTKAYMGFIRLSSAHSWRRIDMWLYTDRSSLPYGILQYTGSKHFNCSMRLFAKKKGLVLNSTGLYYGRDSSRGDGKLIAEARVDGSERVTCEQDIFSLLGLPYIEPTEREAGHPTQTWKMAGDAQAFEEYLEAFGEDDSESDHD